jgi:eukaryotic-like serine/threonine-protein kinase
MPLDDQLDQLLLAWEDGARSRSAADLCADSPELLAELTKRMRQLEAVERLLSPDTDEADERTPPTVAGYAVVDFLGEGGMGTVWSAVQESTGRTVALKVMSGVGMSSLRARGRFRREIELASRLEHVNIARVYDGDVQRGTCFCAMELVTGLRLDKHVERLRASCTRRPHFEAQVLRLMLKVARAVQYAHQRGIIHRDLKPQNIIVDGAGEPHVLDFGLAKELGVDGPSFSLDGVEPGTLQYMSPEQANGRSREVDTRTDVYSLGIVLYEMLLGTPAHDLSGDSGDVRRRVGQNVIRSPRDVNANLDRDLEALLLHAVEGAPADRYGSAQELADDIDGYLAGRPLLARRRTKTYVVRKWLNRHKRGAAIAATVAFVMLSGGLWSFINIAHQRDRAETEAAISEAVNRFILERLLTAVDPSVAQGREPQLRELLDRAATEVGTAFPGQPLVEAAVRQTLGRTYLNLGDNERGRSNILTAYELSRRTLGAQHQTTLRAATLLAFANEGTFEAEALLRDTLAVQRKSIGPRHVDTLETLHRLGNALVVQGRRSEAATLLREAWEGRRAVLGPEHRDTIWSLSDLGSTLAALGSIAEGESLLREALLLRRRTQGERHMDTLNAQSNLGSVLARSGKLEAAEPLLVENVRLRLEVLGRYHLDRTIPLRTLAGVRIKQGKPQDAEALYRESLEVCDHVDADSTGAMQSKLGLVDVLLSLGRAEEAARYLRDVAARAERKLSSAPVDAWWITSYASAAEALSGHELARESLGHTLQRARDWLLRSNTAKGPN